MAKARLHFSKKLLARLYLKDHLSIYRISRRLKCTSSYIQQQLKKHHIKTRTRNEAMKFSIFHTKQLGKPKEIPTKNINEYKPKYSEAELMMWKYYMQKTNGAINSLGRAL